MVVGWQADEERLLGEVDPFCARDLAALCGGVLVADGDVEVPGENARFEIRGRDFAELDLHVGVSVSQSRDRGGYEAREGGGKRAEPELFAVLLGEVGDLGVGERQAPRNVIGVFEQASPAWSVQSAAPAVQQTNAGPEGQQPSRRPVAR